MTVWYARMADIPGIQFTGSPGVVRADLAESSIRPHTEYGYLSWPTVDGSTSASPAHRRAFGDLSELDGGTLVRQVWEGLELPGEPSDYHFLLQGGVERLWSLRREDPSSLRLVETFAYLDLALIEAAPQAVRIDATNPHGGYLRITSLERLLTLLEREGALREALALSHRAMRFGDHYHREDLEAKVASLDGELR
ncbi:hypothetical protein AB0M43_34805 [Longispora sp. NPDC051575]|uniref:hypothetical protein n=1 Tax=Longispora sp. NPDC051575 TaxID=3154943 RepID=UPI003445CE4E